MFGLNITLLFGLCFQAQFVGLFGLKACWKVFIEHMEHIKFMCFRCGIGNEIDLRLNIASWGLDARNFEVFELWTIEPNKPSNFLQTSHTLILQIFVYYLRGPLSTKPILRLMLSKLKLIISSSLVQATRPSPMTRKLITLLFGLCLQAQFAGMFDLSFGWAYPDHLSGHSFV